MTADPGPRPDLVAVANPEPGRDYEVRCETPEFTCVCPMTGQPDFATVTITYVPDQWIVELKSLKLYLWQYRQVGTFHEAVTNKILDDFISTLHPRRITVRTDWLVRGGIHTVVEATHPPAAPPPAARQPAGQ
ncbi:MAG: 7-cyano-7-deazaguanine reductase [Acidimicrobiaceae bacterium]|jgi:7-cyano-7-deazaguanine reductase|nr:7-cyano-7-deazaguanine reductase [Acidimicrobiaceae bacterium]MDQ1364004.1 7-cyano-7-deazaguanine reductase [Acidimicrobiaceae bacterium]MDQ1367975.1 7-cyano-7-deazaguanine reductase [Acidimicrobiaceae bacterium]MDQ1398208.1 7-cyano-7-deazaguanine reductase [Acidimicrobiaceae bacterium]MDQ1417474.1 7-cyano-7-deazaguanine reductase [Acidimicrobiaceae bacterium]